MIKKSKAKDTLSPASTPLDRRARVRQLGREWVKSVSPIILALVGGFLMGGVIVFLSGENPFETYGALLHGAVGNSYNLAATVGRALPIIGTGVAAAVAFKGGLYNLGAEGQMVLGAFCGVLIGLYPPISGRLVLLLALGFSMLGGGLWALLTGWFQTRFGAPILITSLLMNYLATGFVSYMVTFPLIEYGGARSQTPMIAEAARFGRLVPGTTLHYGVFVLLGVILLATFVMRRTVSGYELRMFGANREFALSAGLSSVRLTLMTMLFSGMIAGLSGAIQVFGVHYRLIDTSLTMPGYAWTGLMAAILASNNPLGVVLASLFFAAIQTGAAGVERATNVPFELSHILQAIMILLIATREILLYARREYGA